MRSLGIVVVHVESVEISHNGCFSSWVEGCLGELFYFLIFGIVHPLETVAILLVESNLSIISSCQDMDSPGKSVGNGAMSDQFLFGFGLKVKGEDGAVQVTRANTGSVGRGCDRDDIALRGIERVGLIVLSSSNPDLSLGQSEEEVIDTLLGPHQTRDGTGLQELVAYGLSLLPLCA